MVVGRGTEGERFAVYLFDRSLSLSCSLSFATFSFFLLSLLASFVCLIEEFTAEFFSMCAHRWKAKATNFRLFVYMLRHLSILLRFCSKWSGQILLLLPFVVKEGRKEGGPHPSVHSSLVLFFQRPGLLRFCCCSA